MDPTGLPRCACVKGVQGVPLVDPALWCPLHNPYATREGDHPMAERHLHVVRDDDAVDPRARYLECVEQIAHWSKEANRALEALKGTNTEQ